MVIENDEIGQTSIPTTKSAQCFACTMLRMHNGNSMKHFYYWFQTGFLVNVAVATAVSRVTNTNKRRHTAVVVAAAASAFSIGMSANDYQLLGLKVVDLVR